LISEANHFPPLESKGDAAKPIGELLGDLLFEKFHPAHNIKSPRRSCYSPKGSAEKNATTPFDSKGAQGAVRQFVA